MPLDIAIIAVLALSMVFGWRNGFVYTFLHGVGWILSLVLGFVWYKPLRGFLAEHTGLEEKISEILTDKLGSSLFIKDSFIENFPTIIQGVVRRAAESAVESFALSMSDLLFSLVSFLIVTLACKLILWILIGLLSKRENDGLIGLVDGLWGLIAGFFKGFLIVFCLLALLVPFMSLCRADTALKITGWLEESRFAADLYNNNLIVLIVRTFI